MFYAKKTEARGNQAKTGRGWICWYHGIVSSQAFPYGGCSVDAIKSGRSVSSHVSTVPTSDTVARLMEELRAGKPDAGRELVEMFYPELRRLAASKMRGERSQHTWQPTALVNELYLELLKIRGLADRDYGDRERAAFFGLAGQMMKRLLILHARPLYRKVERVELAEAPEQPVSNQNALHDVEDALSGLEAVDPRFRSVVEMRVFEGLTGEEIAGKLGCSPRSVATYWNLARHWLQKEWAGRTSA